MKVNYNNKDNTFFRGYGARPLKGIFMTSDKMGIASELRKLTPKTELNVFSLDRNFDIATQEFRKDIDPTLIWSQDLFVFREKNLLITPCSPIDTARKIVSNLSNRFGVSCDWQYRPLQGGNFILNETSTHRDLLVGEHDLKIGKAELARRFNADRIISVPQADLHIDYFMFVDGKRAFVCDDNMLLEGVKNTLENLRSQKNKSSMVSEFYSNLLNKFYNLFKAVTELQLPYRASTNDVISSLEKAGYETVKIPGRTYYYERLDKSSPLLIPIFGTNFANSILHKKINGDTVLLTNESANDSLWRINEFVEGEIGFSFKKLFLDTVTKYIKRENIHFIKGENQGVANLLRNGGGIHCFSSEIV